MPTHIYQNKAGQRLPGVTTIIGSNLGWSKGALMYWAWQEGIERRNFRDTSKKAADIGTVAHAMVEADLKELKFDSSKYDKELLDKAETAFLAWLEWKDLVKFDLLESELPLVSEEYGFGGTLDIAAIKNVTSIVDLKTSNGTYPEHLLQIAAYGQLYNENREQKIQAYYLLRLGKEDGSFHYHYWPELEFAWISFKHLLELHSLHKFLKKAV